ncbi:hypothetical protein LOAG_05999 [Loa loa]|uniref:Uncharacterized protein n=1 Tax=Loa loa TaxID=7209 RepID=A0A1S0U0E9_LOALO|nr:hypothetical protein LOAG_05999 [Loa loa]EFO22487.1 hypothetical protein LOAG_05999 [Loa loa]
MLAIFPHAFFIYAEMFSSTLSNTTLLLEKVISTAQESDQYCSSNQVLPKKPFASNADAAAADDDDDDDDDDNNNNTKANNNSINNSSVSCCFRQMNLIGDLFDDHYTLNIYVRSTFVREVDIGGHSLAKRIQLFIVTFIVLNMNFDAIDANHWQEA